MAKPRKPKAVKKPFPPKAGPNNPNVGPGTPGTGFGFGGSLWL